MFLLYFQYQAVYSLGQMMFSLKQVLISNYAKRYLSDMRVAHIHTIFKLICFIRSSGLLVEVEKI